MRILANNSRAKTMIRSISKLMKILKKKRVDCFHDESSLMNPCSFGVLLNVPSVIHIKDFHSDLSKNIKLLTIF